MSKLNSIQKEQLKRITLDAVLQRLTMLETQAYVKSKLGVEISIDYLNHVKMELTRDSKKELDRLRKDRFSYMNQLFFERAQELKSLQCVLWRVIEKSNKKEELDTVVRSVTELHKLSNSLCQMYECLPVLGRLPTDSFTGFGDIDNNDITTTTADKQEEETGEIPPSTLGSGGVYRIDKFNKQM